MELVTCQITEGSIRFGEYSRNLGPGVVLDLDEVVGQRPEGPVRVRDLLAGRLDSFLPVTTPSPAAPRRRTRLASRPVADDPARPGDGEHNDAPGQGPAAREE